MDTLSHDDCKDLVETQLLTWPLARKNYNDLSRVERRTLRIGDLEVALQCNPARIKSTGADVSKVSLEKRPCFLCAANRPPEQIPVELMPGWHLLVNPYPIFPVHFTIVSTLHRPQNRVPDEIVDAAVRLPGMTVFFNGAEAGASAPDHLHMQAVLKEEIPLIQLVERHHNSSDQAIMCSTEFGLDLPYIFYSGVVDPVKGLPVLAAGLRIGGLAPDGSLSDPHLVNVFFWVDPRGILRFISIPRRAHRPRCYFRNDDGRRLVSPGCIDMGGVIILPRKEDFDNLTAAELIEIYNDVAIN